MPVLDGDDAAVVGDGVVQALDCGCSGGDIVLDHVARLAFPNIQPRILADIQAYRRTVVKVCRLEVTRTARMQERMSRICWAPRQLIS